MLFFFLFYFLFVVASSNVFHFPFDFMSDHFFFFFIEVIFFSRCFFFESYSEQICIFKVVFLDLALLFLLVSANPIELLDFLVDLVEASLDGLIFADLTVGHCLGDDIVDLSPSVGLFFINEDQILSLTICSGCSACSMNIGISVNRNSHLDDMGDVEIESSCSDIGGDE